VPDLDLTDEQIEQRVAELASARAVRTRELTAKTRRGEALRKLALAEALEKAEADHGPVGTHLLVLDTETEHGSVIMKRPNKARYRAFMEKKNTKTEDIESIVRSCIVYPDADHVDRLLEDLPGALVRFGSAMATLAGFRNDELTSK
jgi:hypothetical protein